MEPPNAPKPTIVMGWPVTTAPHSLRHAIDVPGHRFAKVGLELIAHGRRSPVFGVSGLAGTTVTGASLNVEAALIGRSGPSHSTRTAPRCAQPARRIATIQECIENLSM